MNDLALRRIHPLQKNPLPYKVQVTNDWLNVGNSINSGQVFLWEKVGKTWYGVNGSDVLAVTSDPFKMRSFSKSPMDFFRQRDDIKKILTSISKDKFVKSAVQSFPGLRLLRQDPFQCFISFIVSSNSNIQNIKQMLQRLCKKFGNKVSFDGKDFFLFPEPKKLATAQTRNLLSCGIGYRAKFVKEAACVINSGKIDLDSLKYEDYYFAKENLLKVLGVGNKVADCILLFSLEKLDAFPLDRWMLRVLQKYYSNNFFTNLKTITNNQYEKLHEEIVNHFGPYSGYSQQFLFKMERDLYKKNWL